MESTKKKLFDTLKAFHNDRDFVLGVISTAKTTENFQLILDFIEEGEDVTVENIITYAMLLDDVTEKPKPE